MVSRLAIPTVLVLLLAFPAGLAASPPAAAPALPSDLDRWIALARAGALPGCEADALRAMAVPLPGPEGSEDGVGTPSLACSGIRPGARMSNGCTMNFVFTDGAQLYVGTAGHCTSSVGQRISAPDIGQFGTVVYRLNGGIGSDFALIRIDAAAVEDVNPAMCVWGGPTGAETQGVAGDVLFHYGWGFVTASTPARSRVQVATGWNNNFAVFWGFGSPGDSGSPLVNEDGEAFAILTHGLTQFGSPELWGTTIQRALSLSRGAGFNVQVVTADFPF